MTVFNNMMKYKTFSDYLIPSEKVISAEHFFSFADKEVVFKPSSGHQGINVYSIKREGDIFRIMSSDEEMICDRRQAGDFISQKIETENYIVQRYINCRTKSGDPYDFRLHVQKGRNGGWICSSIYPRVSPNGSIVCNIYQGGYTPELTNFLKREFGGEHIDIKKYLEIFSLQLAGHLDEIQRELYGEELDELGIDVGLDEAKSLYIYEVNWRPGHPPFTVIDLGVVKNTIHYAMFLARKKE
jgi:UDP-N-acetylmuramoyl-tripeptide--D-alanyl-D-alanine ligase